MHNHQHLHQVVKRDDFTTQNGQVMTVVYVTAEPTFTGVIGGYTTDSGSPETQATETAAPTAAQTQASPTQSSSSEYSSSDSESSFSSSSTSSLGASTPTRSYTPQSQPTSSTFDAQTTNAVSSTSTDSVSSNQEGMSTGAKAGIAIGIILLVGAALALILVLLNKKKRQVKEDQAKQDAEKNAANARMLAQQQQAQQQQQAANAPRLSLRPASSFLPEFMGGNRPKSRLSQGNMLNTMSANGAARSVSPVHQQPQMSEKAQVENPFQDPENPFTDAAAAPRSAPAPAQKPQISMPESVTAPAPLRPSPPAAPAIAAVAAGVAGAGAVAAARSAMAPQQPAQRPSRPASLEKEPTLPEVVPSSMPEPVSPPRSLADPIAMPSPVSSMHSQAPSEQPGQVYRILMDFMPSMEDELELRAGQLVRMLHEYDDGWCLCIRLDRTHQGVVPRTCLAAKPSKPRPRGPDRNGAPSPGPGMRGPPPAGRMSPAMGRPMSPAMARPMSPSVGNNSPGPRPQQQGRPMSPGAYNQAPRPLSPGPRPQIPKQRSQSPGPYGGAGGPPRMAENTQRRRSNSAAAGGVRDRLNSPPGPSRLGPGVPGMAL